MVAPRTILIVLTLVTMSEACSRKERWCHLTGVVLGGDGRPIAGAAARGLSYRHAEDAFFSTPKTVLTDSGGRFALRVRWLPKGSALAGMTLEASSGKSTAQHKLDLGADCVGGGDIRVVLSTQE